MSRFVRRRHVAHVRRSRRRDGEQPRPAVPGHGDRGVRDVPRHAQRDHRARRGRSRRPARDDRDRAAQAQVRAGRAPAGRPATMQPYLRGRLAAELGLDEGQDVFEADGMLGQRDLMEIATLDIPELRDPPHAPAQPVDFLTDGNIFHAIRDAKHLMVHHPYESFQESVERFFREAADDPKVRAIKTTLYRTSKDSERDQAPRARRAERQAGRGRARAQGAVRRRSEHQVGVAHGARRHPRHVRRRRAQDAHEDHARRAPRLRRPAPLRAPRDRQLSRRHRAPLHRPRPVHVRRRASAAISPSCSTT